MKNTDNILIDKDTRQHILGMNTREVEDLIISVGEPKYRAKQVLHEIFVTKKSCFADMQTLPKILREKLEQNCIIESFVNHTDFLSKDESRKYLFELQDGGKIESVLIPRYYDDDEDREITKKTLCISTQVGCSFNCVFCATGKLKFGRNLTAGEIVEQVLAAEKISGVKVSNIVFMGMGEPLMNFDNLIKAINILTDEKNKIISPRRITISTVGLIKQIRQLTKLNIKLKLAISLHSANEELRFRLMPSTKNDNLRILIDAAEEYFHITRMPVTFEYILFKGLNDSIFDADNLAKLIRGFPSKVNIIRYNRSDEKFRLGSTELEPSGMLATENFIERLREAGVNVFLRHSAGSDIAAACGQLAGKN